MNIWTGWKSGPGVASCPECNITEIREWSSIEVNRKGNILILKEDGNNTRPEMDVSLTELHLNVCLSFKPCSQKLWNELSNANDIVVLPFCI